MGDKMQKYRFFERIPPRYSEETSKIVLITGTRQTGKTTLTRNHYSSLRYINTDDPENRDSPRAVPTEFWARGLGGAILDEARKLPAVFEKVKYAFDKGDQMHLACLQAFVKQTLYHITSSREVQ